jgi:GrpB-like predicted nucleotidyltransferase (UPF0157 family)
MPRDMSVVDYDPSWPEAYEAETGRIRRILGGEIVRAHHIGSTAVPGLAAKPVIDILLEVRDVARLDKLDEPMRSIGYEPRGELGIPGRRYYPKGGDKRTHHVHAFVVGDPHIAEHLAFRDYLRTHPSAGADYAGVKRQAAAMHRHDPDGYVAFKQQIIGGILRDALAWADRREDQPTPSGRSVRMSPS